MTLTTPDFHETDSDEPYLCVCFLNINVEKTDEIRTLLHPYIKSHEGLIIYSKPEPLIGETMLEDTVYFSMSFEDVSIEVADEIRNLLLPYLKVLTGSIYYNTPSKD